MRKGRLLWHLYPSYLLITLISLLAVAWYAAEAVRKPYLNHVAADLEARARLVETQVSPHIQRDDSRTVDGLCKDLGALTAMRITIALASGQVIGDSQEDPVAMDNHADRPEIVQALAGEMGSAIRYSYTLRENLMYVATPVKARGRVIAVIRCSVPITSIDRALKIIYARIAIGGIVIAVLAAFVSLLVARRISHPLEEMKRGAERFADGDFTHRLPISNSVEMTALAEAMNDMAEQLDERIRDVERRRNDMEAVLTSMDEGVIALDTEERLLGVNRAAANMLGIDREQVQGRSIEEVIRNTELQNIAAQALAGREPTETEVMLRDERGTILSAHVTPLRDVEDQLLGALIVLGDVTDLRRLEHIRREFVANVSHELKTPITSIRGFAETLLAGAVNNPDEARRFLEVIERQADRLQAIIEDLLALSAIEQESEERQIVMRDGSIADVLEAAAQARAEMAEARGVRLTATCGEDVRARINPDLVEQAVVNLIDNAVKYSDSGSEVAIDGNYSDGEVVISVRDHGCGIEKEYLPRLFERFYRVDKARSRTLGGTGLGLAIVKHIVLAHGGRITVESIPGEGSSFHIHLPRISS